MDGWLRDARHAARNLRRTPGFALVTILTLALGLGANTAIFSVVYGVLLRPFAYRDSASLVVITAESRFAGQFRRATFSASALDQWQARLRAARARTLAALGRVPEGAPEARRAVADGERIGDPVAVAHGLQSRFLMSAWRPGLAYVERALQVIGDRADIGDLRINLLCNRASTLAELGERDAAEQAFREAVTVAEKIGTWRLPMSRVQLGEFLLSTGRWDDAYAELEPAAGKFGFFERILRLGGLAFIAAHRDQRADCDRVLREADRLPPLAGYQRGNASRLDMARAVRAEQRAGVPAALALLAGTVAIEEEPDLFDRHRWLPDLVRLALAAGNRDLAEAALAAAEYDADIQPLPRRVSAARRIRALLDGDPARLLALADGCRSRSELLTAAQTSEEAAVLLAEGGDPAGARAALVTAVGEYRELGADWDARRADARLRERGVRRGPRSVYRRPRTGWAALTPTEERIAALVADGRSNPDIAAQLLLSRRTVQTHVSNILNKLGYASRVEIVRAAVQAQT